MEGCRIGGDFPDGNTGRLLSQSSVVRFNIGRLVGVHSHNLDVVAAHL